MEMPNETSKDVVLVRNSIAVTIGGTWGNSKRSRGQKLDTHARTHTHTHTHTHKEENVFPFLMLWVCQTGT